MARSHTRTQRLHANPAQTSGSGMCHLHFVVLRTVVSLLVLLYDWPALADCAGLSRDFHFFLFIPLLACQWCYEVSVSVSDSSVAHAVRARVRTLHASTSSARLRIRRAAGRMQQAQSVRKRVSDVG
jgi:hypothetical protein